MGCSRVHAKRLVEQGQALADAPPPEVDPDDVESVNQAYLRHRAERMRAQAGMAELRLEEAKGVLVPRQLLDDIMADLSAALRTTSERMRRESPTCVEILREGMKSFDAAIDKRCALLP
jgi:hypothetical protein